jgi:hypothetical protein
LNNTDNDHSTAERTVVIEQEENLQTGNATPER